MKIIDNPAQIPRYKKPVVSIGVFDGVHRAHRQILQDAVKLAHRIKGTSIALTFYPHPQKQDSIYSLSHRIKIIEALGVDVCIVLRFTKSFALMEARPFVEKILVRKIQARYVLVGKDFRFGRNAKGDFRLLASYAHDGYFRLKGYRAILVKKKKISSTYIRDLILRGDLQEARELLVRPVSILGKVVRGTRLATRLGFPTANINPFHEILPPAGIYMVQVIRGKQSYRGICYIGTKPTFNTAHSKLQGPYKKHVEVHIFNFRSYIYGETLEIQFLEKIRDEKRFTNIASLGQQVHKDLHEAQLRFSRHHTYHNI